MLFTHQSAWVDGSGVENEATFEHGMFEVPLQHLFRVMCREIHAHAVEKVFRQQIEM